MWCGAGLWALPAQLWVLHRTQRVGVRGAAVAGVHSALVRDHAVHGLPILAILGPRTTAQLVGHRRGRLPVAPAWNLLCPWSLGPWLLLRCLSSPWKQLWPLFLWALLPLSLPRVAGSLLCRLHLLLALPPELCLVGTRWPRSSWSPCVGVGHPSARREREQGHRVEAWLESTTAALRWWLPIPDRVGVDRCCLHWLLVWPCRVACGSRPAASCCRRTVLRPATADRCPCPPCCCSWPAAPAWP